MKKGTKKPRKIAKTDRFPLIEKALRKRTKADLIETILMIAKDQPVVARELESRLDVEKPLVIRAVKAVGGDEAAKWAFEMQIADRVGFICDKELAEFGAFVPFSPFVLLLGLIIVLQIPIRD